MGTTVLNPTVETVQYPFGSPRPSISGFGLIPSAPAYTFLACTFPPGSPGKAGLTQLFVSDPQRLFQNAAKEKGRVWLGLCPVGMTSSPFLPRCVWRRTLGQLLPHGQEVATCPVTPPLVRGTVHGQAGSLGTGSSGPVTHSKGLTYVNGLLGFSAFLVSPYLQQGLQLRSRAVWGVSLPGCIQAVAVCVFLPSSRCSLFSDRL